MTVTPEFVAVIAILRYSAFVFLGLAVVVVWWDARRPGGGALLRGLKRSFSWKGVYGVDKQPSSTRETTSHDPPTGSK